MQSIRKITPPTFPAHVADRIAASYRPVPMSPADQAAHESASHLSPKGRAALERATSAVQRLEIEAAWDATSQGLAEYEAWVAA